MMMDFLNLFCGLAFSLPLCILVIRRPRDRRYLTKILLLIILIVYMHIMAQVVGIPRISEMSWQPQGSMTPFRDWKLSFYQYQAGMNILMCIPLGILLPLIWLPFRNPILTTLAGLLTSCTVEFLQLFTCRATDIDDIIMNTIGTLIGALLCQICLALRRLLWGPLRVRHPLKESLLDLKEYLLVMLIILGSVVLFRGMAMELLLETIPL